MLTGMPVSILALFPLSLPDALKPLQRSSRDFNELDYLSVLNL
jgi:hypothetical protein